MEKLKRNIKIFWLEHKNPLLFYAIIIIGFILIMRGINVLLTWGSKTNIKAEPFTNTINNTNNINQTMSIEEYYEELDREKLVNTFINYCTNQQIKEAYSMLSENCKKDLYPTIKDFQNNYYQKMFTHGYNIQINYQSQGVYKITFSKNLLESGGNIDNNSIREDYYKIESEIVEDKIYIQYQ